MSSKDTLYGNVSTIIKSLVEKVINDNQNLTPEEEALLGFSTIPILDLITNEVISKPDPEAVIVRVNQYIEVICYDVITTFMQTMLDRVINNVQALKHAQVDDEIIKTFIQDADNTRKYLANAKFGAFQKLQVMMEAKQRLERQGKEFEYKFGLMMQQMK